jgi:hypothetical protein
MPKGDSVLLLDCKKYGNILNKTKIHRYSKTYCPKIYLPSWYHPQLLDKTRFSKRLNCKTRKYLVPDIEFAKVTYSAIKIKPVVPEPWQYKYKREEPYKVGLGVVKTYVPQQSLYGNKIGEYTKGGTFPEGCTKKETKYQGPALRYSRYWLGTPTQYQGNNYIRGQARREKERVQKEKEREAVKLRGKFFGFLKEHWATQNHGNQAKSIKIEEEVKEEDFDYFGHLSEQELVELKKKVKIEEE